MGQSCAQCGAPVQESDIYRYCRSCFDQWYLDARNYQRGNMSLEEYKGKWK